MIYLTLHDGKVWIEYDGIEHGIVQDLVSGGVPPEQQEVRNRKPLRPDSQFNWELRVGNYRVFYDANEEAGVVSIVAVGYKERNKLYIRGQEVNL